jgi:3-oxoacyl-[acyl-carrier protein] reductase
MYVSLAGRYALVTGASRGIGRAVADVLAEAGCSVALSARGQAPLEAAAREVAARFEVSTLAVPADVSSLASVQALFRRVRAWSSGRLDILVSNAGYPFEPALWNTPLHETSPADLEAWYTDVFRTDALGGVFCTREALAMMLERRSGSLVYISSTPALEGFRGAPYTVAKSALLGLMRDVAREYGASNIRANALALGNIHTPATFDRLDPATRDAMAREAPLERWGLPEEAARAVLFLASDLSSFVTGQTLVVDGGALRR